MWDPPPEEDINGVMEGYEVQYGIEDDVALYAFTIEDKTKTVSMQEW